MIRVGEEEKRPISIRGINRKLYEEMSILAKELGKTVGELLNEAMETFLALREGIREVKGAIREGLETSRSIVISNIDDLTLSASDLKDVKGTLIIRNIKRLKFEPDISQDLFDEKIRRIIRVDKLIIPKSLSKVKVLAKCLFVSSVVTETEEE